MATILVTDDFSAQNWSVSGGTPTRVSSPLHAYDPMSLQINPSGAAEYAQYAPFGSTPTRVVAGWWWRIEGTPGSTQVVGAIDMGSCQGLLAIKNTGQMFIRADGTPTISEVATGFSPSLSTWYWLEFMVDKSANPWEIRSNLNGTVSSGTGAQAASNCGSDYVVLGSELSSTYTAYYAYLNYGTAANDSDWITEQTTAPPAPTVVAWMTA